MTIRYLKKHAALEGNVAVEDAEALAFEAARCRSIEAIIASLLALICRLRRPAASMFA